MSWINSVFVDILNWIHSWVGNYGWSVVVFTIFIKLLVLPLEIKSRKGMRAMNRVQPQLQALQKKYANDKDKLNQKTMELYKKENVSMTAGCLPMLIQLPILFIMFNAMRVVANEQTIQMILSMKEGVMPTLQPWLWIKNVFQPDSFMSTLLPSVGDQLLSISKVGYSKILTTENIEAAKAFLASAEYAEIAAQYGAGEFMRIQLNFGIAAPLLTLPNSFYSLMHYANGLFILPILAGATQFLMNKFANGTQKKDEAAEQADANNAMNSTFMKWFFPLFSVWICASSNSAFSIYWMMSNVIAIIQQVVINRVLDREDAKRAAAAEKK